MKNIRFIRDITEKIEKTRHIAGNCIYYELSENRAKIYCDEYGVWVEIINPKNGLIDKVHLPFSNYFAPVQFSQGAPKWTQTIGVDGCWCFENRCPHVLPKDSDYKRIALAMKNYMELFN